MARQRCPVCRSKRWHRDRATGLVVCEEGHILQVRPPPEGMLRRYCCRRADAGDTRATCKKITRRKDPLVGLRRSAMSARTRPRRSAVRQIRTVCCTLRTAATFAPVQLTTILPDLTAVFHGPRLRFLYFQCAQIVLRRQIRALIHEWDLPAELEVRAYASVARRWSRANLLLPHTISDCRSRPLGHVRQPDKPRARAV